MTRNINAKRVSTKNRKVFCFVTSRDFDTDLPFKIKKINANLLLECSLLAQF